MIIKRSRHEAEYLFRLIARLRHLTDFLRAEALPTHDTTLRDWHKFLSEMKAIVGNASNDMSFIAALMAKDYLRTALPLVEFDAGLKAQGAPGLDILEQTTDGRTVAAEIKTTTPYGVTELGAQQLATFKKDFKKLNAASADLKFFFVTDPETFSLMRRKYHALIPDVAVVLLPDGQTLSPL